MDSFIKVPSFKEVPVRIESGKSIEGQRIPKEVGIENGRGA